MSVCYFITKAIYEKKGITEKDLEKLLARENRNNNKKKLNDIISSLYVNINNS